MNGTHVFFPRFGEKSKDVDLADIKFPWLSKLLPASERPNSTEFNLNKGGKWRSFWCYKTLSVIICNKQ